MPKRIALLALLASTFFSGLAAADVDRCPTPSEVTTAMGLRMVELIALTDLSGLETIPKETDGESISLAEDPLGNPKSGVVLELASLFFERAQSEAQLYFVDKLSSGLCKSEAQQYFPATCRLMDVADDFDDTPTMEDMGRALRSDAFHAPGCYVYNDQKAVEDSLEALKFTTTNEKGELIKKNGLDGVATGAYDGYMLLALLVHHQSGSENLPKGAPRFSNPLTDEEFRGVALGLAMENMGISNDQYRELVQQYRYGSTPPPRKQENAGESPKQQESTVPTALYLLGGAEDKGSQKYVAPNIAVSEEEDRLRRLRIYNAISTFEKTIRRKEISTQTVLEAWIQLVTQMRNIRGPKTLNDVQKEHYALPSLTASVDNTLQKQAEMARVGHLIEMLNTLKPTYTLVANGDYKEAVLSLASQNNGICYRVMKGEERDVDAGGAHPDSRSSLLISCRALPFLARLAEAESDEIEDLVKQYMSPIGSYRRKQREEMWSLNAMVGFAGGNEKLDATRKSSPTTGAFIPIAVEKSWPVKYRYIGNFAIGISFADLGAVLSYADNSGSEASSAANVKFSSVLAPGFYIATGLRDSPFRLGLSYTKAPELREVEGSAGIFDDDAERMQVFITVDLSILGL